MKKTKKVRTEKSKKKVFKMILIFIAVIVIAIGAFAAITSYRINQIPSMTFEEMLAYTTKGNENAAVTVGIIKNGESSFTVYGADGSVLPQQEHIYEIGSVTKTFTAALLLKAIEESKTSMDDRIDQYLDLPQKNYYPTIKRLITHTSGYKEYYFETPMISNFFNGRNDFNGITADMLISRIGNIDLEDRDYSFKYSNFGISVVGAVLEKIYAEDYHSLVNAFAKNEMQLKNTKISDGNGDLGKLWAWQENDAYLPAGGLLSTISDMLLYAQIQLDKTSYFSSGHERLMKIDATTASYGKMNVRMDEIGATWLIDTQNDIVWHNGGTGDYNCYIGFDLERQLAVVILSNLSPNYRIPATVMGIKLLTDLQKTNSLS